MNNSAKENYQTNVLNDPDAATRPLTEDELKRINSRIKHILLLGKVYRKLLEHADVDQEYKDKMMEESSVFISDEAKYLHFYEDCRAEFIFKSLATEKKVLVNWLNHLI